MKILFKLGWHYQWNKPDSAIMYGLEGKQLAEQLNYVYGQIMMASTLGEALSTKGNYSEALAINLKANQLAEESGNQRLINETTVSRAGIYFYSGDYKNALTFYLKGEKSRTISDQFQDMTSNDELAFGFIGETYYHLNQLDSAYLYISKACQLDQNLDNDHWSIPYYYLALIQLKQGKLKEALKNSKLGLLLF